VLSRLPDQLKRSFLIAGRRPQLGIRNWPDSVLGQGNSISFLCIRFDRVRISRVSRPSLIAVWTAGQVSGTVDRAKIEQLALENDYLTDVLGCIDGTRAKK